MEIKCMGASRECGGILRARAVQTQLDVGRRVISYVLGVEPVFRDLFMGRGFYPCIPIGSDVHSKRAAELRQESRYQDTVFVV